MKTNLLLSLRIVLAFPNASKSGLLCSTHCSTEVPPDVSSVETVLPDCDMLARYYNDIANKSL